MFGSTFQLFVEPQARKDGTGPWLACPEHAAQRWAVRSRRRDGKRWITVTYATYGKKRQAYEDLARRLAADSRSKFAPPQTLGARWPKQPGRTVIAESNHSDTLFQRMAEAARGGMNTDPLEPSDA